MTRPKHVPRSGDVAAKAEQRTAAAIRSAALVGVRVPVPRTLTDERLAAVVERKRKKLLDANDPVALYRLELAERQRGAARRAGPMAGVMASAQAQYRAMLDAPTPGTGRPKKSAAPPPRKRMAPLIIFPRGTDT